MELSVPEVGALSGAVLMHVERRGVRTAVHAKQWWKLRLELKTATAINGEADVLERMKTEG